MTDVLIIGGGPAGLGAALYTAKNDLETVVVDDDETWMHKAYLFNYLGIDEVDGSEFMEKSRDQVADFGASLESGTVADVEDAADGFRATTEDGTEYEGRYLVLATGAERDLAEELGCAFDDEVVDATINMRTSVEDVYATGAMVRAEKWQAQIAAGDGTAAALDILSKEKGENFHDFDVPDDAE